VEEVGATTRMQAGPEDDAFAAATADELRAAVAELRAAVRARDDFIAIAAHELRNPMTPIAGQIQLLLAAARRGGAPQPQVVIGLERLEAAVRHYIRRATTLLDISRASSGQLRLEPALVDVSALVRETAQGYALLAARAGCPLRLDVPDGVAATLDRLAVEQVLDNLISNALRFGAGKPIDVRLTAGGDGLALAVRDRGAGLSEADRARIFGRFEQAVGQRRHGGFGIGLWLVYRLVSAMGGDVAVESRPGEGATFVVRLPLRMDEGAAGAAEEEGRS
jgi:signal transduction histidine kinase